MLRAAWAEWLAFMVERGSIGFVFQDMRPKRDHMAEVLKRHVSHRLSGREYAVLTFNISMISQWKIKAQAWIREPSGVATSSCTPQVNGIL